jgi:hypothetical protein
MRRLLVTLVLAGSMVAAAVAEVNFVSGPSFVQTLADPPTYNLSAEATGLGNTPIVGTITINGNVLYTCTNKGGKRVPGRNPVPTTVKGSQEANPADHNGRGVLDLTVVFDPPDTVSADEIGCPNGNWIGIDPVVQGPVTATAVVTFQGTTLFTQTI